ncbi:MAG: hypothetical protein JXB88_08400 [Spirochaetales bacterium]|nr:hypothetical protein [Spirochaetales bacterium]
MKKNKLKKKGKPCYIKVFTGLIFLLFITPACKTSYVLPDEYVPDKEVVYLKQKTGFGPIEYPPVLEEPYSWTVNPVIDRENPGFLKITSFKTILIPDFHADATLFLEVKEHLKYIEENKNYLHLKELLDNYEFVKPGPRKIAKGDLVKTYTNSTEYEYPEIEGATIVYFKNGDYKINLPGGFTYYYKRDGSYFENDAEGNEVYAVFPEKDNFRMRENGITYICWPMGSKKIETGYGAVSYHRKGKFPEQYIFFPDPKSDKNHYTFFINEDNTNTYINEYGLRYDYFLSDDRISISYKNEAVIIENTYRKSHYHYDRDELKTEDRISFYLPEGIRFLDLDKSLSYSEVNPNWPEDYLQKKLGPFIFLYTRKDEELLVKVNKKRLEEIYRLAEKMTGLSSAPWRTILLPPDLQAYRKIHAGDEPEKLNWYPSGFQGKDIIVMWPPSVPRYTIPEGDMYFWNEEFYEILIHELVHLFVGESTGLLHSVPVWLNEGLAIYVESTYSEFTRKYWDITFEVAFIMKKLLNWDDVAIHSTSYFPVTDARTHYAQSYKMTTFLIKEYGIEKVIKYLKSFKTGDSTKESPFEHTCITNFKEIFGITWDKNVVDFYLYIQENIKKD